MNAVATTDVAEAPPTDAEPEPTRWELWVGGFAAFMAALLPGVIEPAAASPTFTPKYALLVVLAAAGLPPLVRLAISSRYAWTARAALAFVAVGALSAALSPSKLVGFFGLYDWGTGEIFLVGLASAWAIGVSSTPRTRRWLVNGLVVGVTANAVAAVVQTAFSLNTQDAALSGFGLFNGTQADGMMGNPIHLEAILLGGMALLLGRTCRARWPQVLPIGCLVALYGAALACSSERYAVVLLALLLVYAVVAYRRHSSGYVVASAFGFGVTFLSGAGASLSQRVATGNASSTFTLRIRAAGSAVLATLEHRTLLGFGPGQMRNALELYQSRSFSAAVGPNRYFLDVHDLPANMLVMTGVVGFVLFVCFFLGTSWRVRGALAGFAALCLLVELAEPLNNGVTPVAFLALGAALAASRGEAFDLGAAPASQLGRRPLVAFLALGCAALVPAGVLVAGDIIEHSAKLHYSLDDAKRANSLLPIWPETAQQVSQIYAYLSVVDRANSHANLVQSRDWLATAAARDPSDVNVWVRLTAADLSLNDLTGALAAADRAVSADTFDAGSQTAAGAVDAAMGNWDGAIGHYGIAHEIAPHLDVVTLAYQAALAHDASYFHH